MMEKLLELKRILWGRDTMLTGKRAKMGRVVDELIEECAAQRVEAGQQPATAAVQHEDTSHGAA